MMKLEAKKKHDPEPENAQIDINGKKYSLKKLSTGCNLGYTQPNGASKVGI